MEDRIIELETKFAHQDHLLEELNKVVTEQASEIDLMKKQIEQLQKAYLEDSDEGIIPQSEEKPPPHY